MSDYIVKVCAQEKDSYLLYKKKNFLNNQEKTQNDVVERIYTKIKQRQEELKPKKVESNNQSNANLKS